MTAEPAIHLLKAVYANVDYIIIPLLNRKYVIFTASEREASTLQIREVFERRFLEASRVITSIFTLNGEIRKFG